MARKTSCQQRDEILDSGERMAHHRTTQWLTGAMLSEAGERSSNHCYCFKIQYWLHWCLKHLQIKSTDCSSGFDVLRFSGTCCDSFSYLQTLCFSLGHCCSSEGSSCALLHTVPGPQRRILFIRAPNEQAQHSGATVPVPPHSQLKDLEIILKNPLKCATRSQLPTWKGMVNKYLSH